MDSDIIEQKNNTILKLTLVLDKLFTVLDDFRQNLNAFQKSCNCIENHKNKSNFDELEDEYKTIVEEYNQNKSQIDVELDLNSGKQPFPVNLSSNCFCLQICRNRSPVGRQLIQTYRSPLHSMPMSL